MKVSIIKEEKQEENDGGEVKEKQETEPVVLKEKIPLPAEPKETYLSFTMF